jgi:hypothetical protein
MYFSSKEALEPHDLKLLRVVLEDVCVAHDMSSKGKGAEEIAKELFCLWEAGFQSYDELRALLKPVDIL